MTIHIPQSELDRQAILASNHDLIGMGAALHLLKPRDKAPIASGWSTAPRATEADLSAAYIPGANIGVRLGEPSKTPAGYLQLIDLGSGPIELLARAASH